MKRKRITAVTDASGHRCSEEADVLEVFAKFYEDLYAALSTKVELQHNEGQSEAVTPEEVILALKKLRPGRSCGDDGLYAEMLDESSRTGRSHYQIYQ